MAVVPVDNMEDIKEHYIFVKVDRARHAKPPLELPEPCTRGKYCLARNLGPGDVADSVLVEFIHPADDDDGYERKQSNEVIDYDGEWADAQDELLHGQVYVSHSETRSLAKVRGYDEDGRSGQLRVSWDSRRGDVTVCASLISWGMAEKRKASQKRGVSASNEKKGAKKKKEGGAAAAAAVGVQRQRPANSKGRI